MFGWLKEAINVETFSMRISDHLHLTSIERFSTFFC